jgi:hypothetical protein
MRKRRTHTRQSRPWQRRGHKVKIAGSQRRVFKENRNREAEESIKSEAESSSNSDKYTS